MNTSIDSQIEARLAEMRTNPGELIARFDRNGDGTLDADEWAAARATVAREVLGMSANCPETLVHQRYRLISQIGHGAQGQTFLAHDQHTGQLVALKTLHVKLAHEWKAIDLFQREAEALRKLNHPGIPAYIDAFEENDGTEFYLAQTFVAGDNLEVRLARFEMFDQKRLEHIARGVLEILGYLHSQYPPVLHRDIKPANMILGADDKVFLVDFGAVQNQGSRGTTIVGTTGYMPPEQLAGRAAPGSDLYALAATLVHVATRCHPAELPVKRLKLDWRSRANLDAHFSNWLDKLLEPDVEARPKDARQALRDLDDENALAIPSTADLVPVKRRERSIQLNTNPQRIERLTYYRNDGDLLVFDEDENHSDTIVGYIISVLGIVFLLFFMRLGLWALLFLSLVLFGTAFWSLLEGSKRFSLRFSKERGLIWQERQDRTVIPLRDLEEPYVKLTSKGEAGVPMINIKPNNKLQLSRTVTTKEAERIVHEIRLWILENADD